MNGDSAETVAEYHCSHGPTVTHCRGTLIVSSIEVLRQRGHFEAYARELPALWRDDILGTVAASWLSLEMAQAHYLACEALKLPPFELDAIATTVSNRLAETLIATFLRSTRSIGGSPWQSLTQSTRLWSRLLRGGAIRVTREGPKDALVESRGLPLFEVPYFARGYGAMLRGAALLFAKTVYVRVRSPAVSTSHAAVLSWV